MFVFEQMCVSTANRCDSECKVLNPRISKRADKSVLKTLEISKLALSPNL